MEQSLYVIHDGTLGIKPPAHVGYYTSTYKDGATEYVYWTGFPGAQVFITWEAAQEVLKRLDAAHNSNGPAIVGLDEWPAELEDPLFATCHPLSRDSAPKAGQVVEIRYRNGQRSGVSGDFLLKELRAGRFISDPRAARWREVPIPAGHTHMLNKSGGYYAKLR